VRQRFGGGDCRRCPRSEGHRQDRGRRIRGDHFCGDTREHGAPVSPARTRDHGWCGVRCRIGEGQRGRVRLGPRYVPGHPMAGSELHGLDGADASMFEAAVWVLTPTAATSDSAFNLVAETVTRFGAEVVALQPAQHDDLVAMVSHVPHLTAATLMGWPTSDRRSIWRSCASQRVASGT
ncbi:MAG: prephenate dehydrogenase/arogenate dehydrogenase family protein, partial [Planctomycetes bacterium]|nr:prephenate dehydrogenase/arogenate dehydrogenase family protein [Planctomycetota bacterium]